MNEEMLIRLQHELDESLYVRGSSYNTNVFLSKLWDGSGVAESHGWLFDSDTPWDYTYEVAVHTALAILSEFLSDWHDCFSSQSELIPEHIPESYPEQLIETLTHWLEHPHTACTAARETVYYWIKNEICLDGYLAQTYPSLPPVIESFCMCGVYLVDVDAENDSLENEYETCLNEISREWVGDGTAWFLPLDSQNHRIHNALLRHFNVH